MNNSRRQVEDEVKRAKLVAREKATGQPTMPALLPPSRKNSPKAALPVRVNYEMTPIQFARYEKLIEQVRKNRSISSDKVDALLEIIDGFLE